MRGAVICTICATLQAGWRHKGATTTHHQGPELLDPGPSILPLFTRVRGKQVFSEVRGSKLGRSGRGLGTWTGAERGSRINCSHPSRICGEEALQTVAT